MKYINDIKLNNMEADLTNQIQNYNQIKKKQTINYHK